MDIVTLLRRLANSLGRAWVAGSFEAVFAEMANGRTELGRTLSAD